MKRNSADQDLLVELWRFIESRGMKASIAMICRMVRATGLSIRNEDAYRYLGRFAEKAASHEIILRERRERFSPTMGEARENTESIAGAPSCVHDIVSLVPDSRLLSSKPSSSRGGSEGRQTRLPSPEEIRAREILAAIWPRVEPHIGKMITLTAWRARNKGSALEMAQAGIPVADAIMAHESASKRMGTVVYTLRLVHDELVRAAIPAASRNGYARNYDEPERYSSDLSALR
jgi:hypothetical protein